MASRSMLGSVANGFAAATVAVAVAGEAIALVKGGQGSPSGQPRLERLPQAGREDFGDSCVSVLSSVFVFVGYF